MSIRSATPRGRAVGVLGWSAALMTLGLLTAALLSLPFQLFAVRTGSMQPTVAPRAVVLVHTGEFRPGMPITFTHEGNVITHRLMSYNANGTIVTQGDANKTPDPWVVQRADVIGGVVATIPHLGYWLVYLKSVAGLGSVVFTVLASVLLWALARDLGGSSDNTCEPAEPSVNARPAFAD